MFARRMAALSLIGSLAVASAAAQTPDPGAQAYPNRPIRIVVPFPAGGPTDILSRVVAQRLSEVWGPPVVIENQPGANTGDCGGARRQDAGRRLHPTGGDGRHHGAQPDHQQEPVVRAAQGLFLDQPRRQEHIAADGAGRRRPASVAELIARAKASPGKLNYGAGIITTRLAGYLFNREPASTSSIIPFNGSAPTVQGLLTGAVDYIVDGTTSHVSLIKSGKLRALAKLNSRPLVALPDVKPLSVEANNPALDDISTWIGFVAPPRHAASDP